MKEETDQSKALPAILALLGCAIVAAAFLYVMAQKQAPTNNPTPSSSGTRRTSSMKSYTNKNFNYALQYPSDWVLDESRPDRVSLNSPEGAAAKKSVAEMAKQGIVVDEYREDLVIFARDNILMLPDNFFGFKTVDEFIAKNEQLHNTKTITFGGFPAYATTSTAGFGDYYTIFVDHNGRVYEIQFGRRKAEPELTAEDKKILASFRFI